MLPALLPLMYRMMDRSRVDGCGNVAEDEGVSCRANQLPRLLGVVVNILTKRSTTDQVFEMCSLAEKCVTFTRFLNVILIMFD